jgi:hypothetical protein
VCGSSAQLATSPKIEEPRRSVFGDVVLRGLIVAVVQATPIAHEKQCDPDNRTSHYAIDCASGSRSCVCFS